MIGYNSRLNISRRRRVGKSDSKGSLYSAAVIYGGGPGSGCNPAVAVPQCGRPPSKEAADAIEQQKQKEAADLAEKKAKESEFLKQKAKNAQQWSEEYEHQQVQKSSPAPAPTELTEQKYDNTFGTSAGVTPSAIPTQKFFNESSKDGKAFNVLKDGQWHHINEVAQATDHPNHALAHIKKKGQTNGQWTVERAGKEYRLLYGSKPLTVQQEASEKSDVDKARPYAEQIAKLIAGKSVEDIFGLGTGWGDAPLRDIYSKYMNDMGISAKAQSSLQSAVQNWAGSANDSGALSLRAVAADYYNRKWSDECCGQGCPSCSKPSDAAISAIKPALMALKNLNQALAEEEGTTTITRGVYFQQLRDYISKQRQQGVHDAWGDVDHNSLSSWRQGKHSGFGNVRVREKLDPANVWVSYRTTPWMLYGATEREMIIGHHAKTTRYYDLKGEIEI